MPGDKSISHRALILGALAIGETRVYGLLEGHDVLATAGVLCALGANMERSAHGCWRVWGTGVGGIAEPEQVLDFGNSGTAARLLAGVLATHPVFAVLTGDGSLCRRPMRRVTEPLEKTGARFAARAGGTLPMAVEGTGGALPVAHRLRIPSAQVKSALLLAGLNTRGVTRVEEPAPTRDHTETLLGAFGARIGVSDNVIELYGPADLAGTAVHVPGDISSAAFPLVAAAIVPGSCVTVDRVGLNPRRTGILHALEAMDATLDIRLSNGTGERFGTIKVSGGTPLRALDLAPEAVPGMIDELPVLAVACAVAHGRSRLRGLAELRVKESDRLAAIARMLDVNGVAVSIEGDDVLIEGAGGPVPGGGCVETRMDHRIAMSALVLGCAAQCPVRVDDTSFIDTSFPGFAPLMTSLGAVFA